MWISMARGIMVSSHVNAKAYKTFKLIRNAVAHCSQAVLLPCLYLSHGMVLREVGMYAWTVPTVKDPTGSMMNIMKRTWTAICQVYLQKEKADGEVEEYEKQIKAMSRHVDLRCRSVRSYPTYSRRKRTLNTP